jgi:hypothetical protein
LGAHGFRSPASSQCDIEVTTLLNFSEGSSFSWVVRGWW